AANGGSVSGAGAIAGNADFSRGGVLAGTQGQTLAIEGNLRLDDASVVDVALGAAPGGVSGGALFDVGGDLTLAGTLDVRDLGGLGPGLYRLFDYQGALLGDDLVIGRTPADVVAGNLEIQTAMAGQVNLLSLAGVDLQFWDGGDTARHGNGAIDGGDGIW